MNDIQVCNASMSDKLIEELCLEALKAAGGKSKSGEVFRHIKIDYDDVKAKHIVAMLLKMADEGKILNIASNLFTLLDRKLTAIELVMPKDGIQINYYITPGQMIQAANLCKKYRADKGISLGEMADVLICRQDQISKMEQLKPVQSNIILRMLLHTDSEPTQSDGII